MADNFKIGDTVYLTPAAQDFLSRNRGPSFNINVIGRLGYILDIYDWSTERGKDILKKREKSSLTWKKLKSKDFKYVVVTVYPELKDPNTEKQGMAIPEILCEFHPMADNQKIPLFRKWPGDLLAACFAKSIELQATLKVNKEEINKDVPGSIDKPSKRGSTKLPGSRGVSAQKNGNGRGNKKV